MVPFVLLMTYSFLSTFADMLFPGVSTIQTRARYFLFIPWIYLDLERRRVRSAEVAARARREEIRLIVALLESDDTDGVIGKATLAYRLARHLLAVHQALDDAMARQQLLHFAQFLLDVFTLAEILDVGHGTTARWAAP